MQEIKLEAKVRGGKSSKKELAALRTQHLIPGVIYGGKKPPINVVIVEKELMKATKAAGANAILRLKHPEGEDTVILKELQRHVVTRQPTHADFQRINLTQKIEVKVPLEVVGEAPGVKLSGGVLEHILRELKVRALPARIPHHVAVDVSQLQLNQSLLVKDLSVPAEIEVLDAPDHIVVNVVQPTAEEAPAPGADAAAGAAEPEVIAKGKKEEEGAEGVAAAPAKGAAPAAAKEGAKEGAKKESGK